MLTVSMSVRFGLSNGAIDIVEDLINLNDRRPPPLSDVMVNIPNYSLFFFYLSTPKLFLLFPLNVKLTAHAEVISVKENFYFVLDGHPPFIVFKA